MIERSHTLRRSLGRLPVTLVAFALLVTGSPAAGAEGASLELFHGPDELGTMALEKLRIVLDGKDLGVPLPVAGADPEKALFTGAVAPGIHKLEVEATLQNDSSLFTYMDGYHIKMRSLLELEVIAGEGVAIRSRVLPRGGMTAPWEERNKLVLTLSAAHRPGARPSAVAAAEPASPAPASKPAREPAAVAAAPASEPAREPAAVAAAPASEPAREPAAVAAAPASEPAREPAAAATARASEPARVAATAAAAASTMKEPKPPPPAAEPPTVRAASAGPRPVAAPATRTSADEATPAARPARTTRVAAAPRSRDPEPAPAPRQRSARPTAAGSAECPLAPLRFEFDKATLTDTARTELDVFGACIAATSLKVRVEGHTDARGADEYNRWLAWDRAAAVSAYLRERGLAPRRIITRFAGRARPLCEEASEDCYARNRRVEVITVE